MVKRMLVDATHPEETRVVILNGTRLEEFDFETSTKKQLKGNIYLAKVTRVEPSLQAAFVEFGGNRHGFLAFSEIHPDYYQIPVADRMALLAEQEHDLKQSAEVDEPVEAQPVEAPVEPWQPETLTPEVSTSDTLAAEPAVPDQSAEASHAPAALPDTPSADPGFAAEQQLHGDNPPHDTEPYPPAHADATAPAEAVIGTETALVPSDQPEVVSPAAAPARPRTHYEEVGGDDQEDTQEAMAARRKARSHRHRYKIQEVIKRRQILLVQVVKEERGTKGAALTTYLSLAGRYCVLMPNTSRGGGVSRRIPSAGDRKRLKECMDEMEVPEGMAVILRTAAVERSKVEIKRDFEYLLRQWDNVRELTLQSVAPTLVYEEASLIKRAIRDLYLKDIDEVLVEGDDGYRMAKEFMRVLMPSHAKKVQLYSDPEIPLYHRYQVEPQLDAMHSPTVNLKSGGYIVINPTEALVAIDVNSGRATRERNIEETAYKTNLEAAEEVARQLRLRDLGGLIVIDFIDMEDQRNVHTVEKRLKEAMKADRARIQIGRISPFGLLELSRQRLRPSLLEASAERCPHCAGSGMIRSTESTALHVLRSVEEEGIRHRTAEVALTLPPTVALYILNQKRARLNEIEQRYHFTVRVTIDDALIPPAFKLERVRAREAPPPGTERPAPIAAGAVDIPTPAEIEEGIETVTEPVEVEEETVVDNVETVRDDSDHGEDGRRRRRGRRGRRGGREDRGERGDRGDRGPREERAAREERGSRDDRGPREDRGLREDRGPREDRAPREERGPREDRGEGHREPRQHQPRERFGLTPADVGAMLDGRPVSTLDDEDEGLQPGNAEGDHQHAEGHGPEELGPDGQPRRRRRRGRRGGRRRRRNFEEGQEPHGASGEGEQPFVPAHGEASGESRPHESRHEPEGRETRETRETHEPHEPREPAPERRPERHTEHAPEPRQETPPARPPEPEAPSGPPRKGWWQRFTS